MPPVSETLLTRLQLVALVALFVSIVAVPWLGIRYSDHAYVVSHRADGYWISAPQPVGRTTSIRLDRRDPPTVRFTRTVHVLAPWVDTGLWVRALHDWKLSINGRAIPDARRSGPGWKEPQYVAIAKHLAAGSNEIEIEVSNPHGPALLQAWSEERPEVLGTGAAWSQTSGGRRTAAVVAQDVRIYPQGHELPDPMRILGQRWLGLLALFLLCAAPFYHWRASAPAAIPRALVGDHLPRTAFATVGVVFLLLFLRKALEIPLVIGFDGEAHLDYIQFLIDERRVPRADEGWAMFHPPLYHGLAGMLRELFSAEPRSMLDRALVRILPILSGLIGAWFAGRATGRIFPGRPGLAALAVLTAGLLPMNLYISVLASNEPVHAALVAAGTWLTCELLLESRANLRTAIALSCVLGIALVTKSTTSLPVAALLIAAVGLKLWVVEDRPLPRSLAATAALAVGPLLIAGWFYYRNWVHFDDPFISNINAFEPFTYWLPPGFHTPEWLLGFGEVFTRPFFGSFHSFADGFYGSFWGDGYASGRAGVMFPNPWWDYATMATIYPLAVPATLILALGFGVCTVESLRGQDLGRRLALLTLVTVAVGMLLMSILLALRLPANPMPKAFYTLPALISYAVAFAAGTGWLWERLEGQAQRILRASLGGYLGVLALTIGVAFLR